MEGSSFSAFKYSPLLIPTRLLRLQRKLGHFYLSPVMRDLREIDVVCILSLLVWTLGMPVDLACKGLTPVCSILLDRCEAGFRVSGLHTQRGNSPQLQYLFTKLCRLLGTAVTLVFVFDGPGRPTFKRGHTVINRNLWHIQHAKTIIEALGCHWHDVCYILYMYFRSFHKFKQAPGEAEAELAVLNRLGHVDAVMTDDSDALVFGALCIIRR